MLFILDMVYEITKGKSSMLILDKYPVHMNEIISNKEQNHYIIYTEGCYPYDDGKIKSDEWYDTQQEARFAAIGHITLLENGE